MTYYFGIYGFEITREASVHGLVLTPKEDDFRKAQKLATDRNSLNLTAIGTSDAKPNPEILFDLSGAMTFCQQQWVDITAPFVATDIGQAKKELATSFDLPHQRGTSGALIKSDVFVAEARRSFLELCLDKLADKSFDKATGFRKAFFRNVEIRRPSGGFLDVTYYLNFSALEILVRTASGDYKKPFAELATPFLQNHGFDVVQEDLNSRVRSVQTYAHLRNALFHQGDFEATVNQHGACVTLKLSDYVGNFTMLVPDVLLKVLGYDDGRINWNRWLDRIPWRST